MENKMRYGQVAHVPLPVSRVVFGTLHRMVENEDAFDILDAAFAAGINTFDTAASYGSAELSLGRWIKARGLRDQVVILTKGADPYPFRNRLTEYDILHDIENSFAKLQTDHVDLYILHRDDPSVPVGPIVELLDRLHRQGRIGAYGGSNWTLARTQAANRYAAEHGLQPFTACSPSYSLAECIGDPWGGSVTISGESNHAFRAWLRQTGMAVFPYSSLGRGFWSGRLKSTDADRAAEIVGAPTAEEYAYPVNFERLRRAETLAAEKGVTVPQLAYAWLMHQDLDIYGITAPGTPEHLEQTVAALSLELTPAELAWLNLEQATR